jgi:hypothetical protein
MVIAQEARNFCQNTGFVFYLKGDVKAALDMIKRNSLQISVGALPHTRAPGNMAPRRRDNVAEHC